MVDVVELLLCPVTVFGATDLGHVDQADLANEFRTVAGVTPGR